MWVIVHGKWHTLNWPDSAGTTTNPTQAVPGLGRSESAATAMSPGLLTTALSSSSAAGQTGSRHSLSLLPIEEETTTTLITTTTITTMHMPGTGLTLVVVYSHCEGGGGCLHVTCGFSTAQTLPEAAVTRSSNWLTLTPSGDFSHFSASLWRTRRSLERQGNNQTVLTYWWWKVHLLLYNVNYLQG